MVHSKLLHLPSTSCQSLDELLLHQIQGPKREHPREQTVMPEMRWGGGGFGKNENHEPSECSAECSGQATSYPPHKRSGPYTGFREAGLLVCPQAHLCHTPSRQTSKAFVSTELRNTAPARWRKPRRPWLTDIFGIQEKEMWEGPHLDSTELKSGK